MSQQSQKDDQLISDVYSNLRIQIEKLKEMNENRNSDMHPNDWLEQDVNKLDIHLWAKTQKARKKKFCKENQYKEIKLEKKN